MAQKLTECVSLWAQKLTLLARDTISPYIRTLCFIILKLQYKLMNSLSKLYALNMQYKMHDNLYTAQFATEIKSFVHSGKLFTQ
jgi:hypothetical protein